MTLTYSEAERISAKAGVLLQQALLKQQAGQDAQSALIQAIELYQQVIGSEQPVVPAYLGLAYVFFSSGNRDYAERLLYTAEYLEPYNLQIQTLRNQFEKSAHSTDTEHTQIDAHAMITSLSTTKSVNKELSVFERMFSDLQDLASTFEEFTVLFQEVFEDKLDQQNLEIFWGLINGHYDLPTAQSHFKQWVKSLHKLNPAYERNIQRMTQDFIHHPAIKPRVLHVQLKPLQKLYPDPRSLFEAIKQRYHISLSKEQVSKLFELSQTHEVPDEVIPELETLFKKLIPTYRHPGDLRLLLTALSLKSAAVLSKELIQRGKKCAEALTNPQILSDLIFKLYGLEWPRIKLSGLYYFLQGKNHQGTGAFGHADIPKLQTLLLETRSLNKEQLKQSNEYAKELGPVSTQAYLHLLKQLEQALELIH